MPLRSVKMNRFIFGFQRRVWCPKWTPLSKSCRVVTTAMAAFLPCRHVQAPAYGSSAPNPSALPDARATRTRPDWRQIETECDARTFRPVREHAKSDLMADLHR